MSAVATPLSRAAAFTLEERDLRRAARLHVFSSIRQRRTLIKLSALWMAAMAALVAILVAAGTPWREVYVVLPIFALIVTAATFGVATGLPLALSPLVIRRRFRQDKPLRQTVSASWDEDAYEVRSPSAQSRVDWRDDTRRSEDRHLFVFFLSDYNYQVLPKRTLTGEQIEDIRRILAAV